MAKTYIGQETVAREISTYMGNTHGELVNPNWCSKETLQAMADLLGTPDDTASADENSTIIALAKYIQDYLTKGVFEKIVAPIGIKCSYQKTTINGKGVIFGTVDSSYIRYIKVDGVAYNPTASGDGYGTNVLFDGIPFERSVQITSNLTLSGYQSYPLVVVLY